jgi:hypothetical protein
MIAALEQRTRDEMGEGATVLDYAEQWIASGKTILDLARDLATQMGEPISREIVSHYLNTFSEDAKQRIAAARIAGAHALAEEAKEIVDDAEVSREGISHAKLRADTRFWIAERWNRDELGGAKGAQINVSIGQLHLDALRTRAARPPVTATVPAPTAIVDAEVLELPAESESAAA